MSKQYTITRATEFQRSEGLIGSIGVVTAHGDDDMQVNDGYHTMDELYNHRITLYIALAKALKGLSDASKEVGEDSSIVIPVWRSKYHSDGELCFGTGTQFILGIFSEKGEQISYHIPIERWSECDFADTLEKAPEWDGHNSNDVIKRLKEL